jgi:hypothetical protein
MTKSYKTTLAALALATLLGGCNATWFDPHGYLDRRDSIWLGAGDAKNTNIATQMYDPWAPHSANTQIAMNGQRAQTAAERYRYGKVIAPRGISASSSYGPPTQDSGGAAAPPMPVLGPAVTQVK